MSTLSDAHAFAVVGVIALVTLALRAAPFLVLRKPAADGYLRHLGEKTPTGVMVLLVAYTLKDLDVTVRPFGLPTLVPLAVAAVTYARTDNALLSIGGGVALHMVLVNGLV
ncbi:MULTISPECIES: branched-chain amino acid transporter permease [unclassified Streptomyces]|uniref:branched-chain amino acid transporter permease n=1 Tax=unclassified Streptomyces TaxID=2593676 RepID=UPI0035D99EE9